MKTLKRRFPQIFLVLLPLLLSSFLKFMKMFPVTVACIKATWRTCRSNFKKQKSSSPDKNSSYLGKWNFLALILKNWLYFQKWNHALFGLNPKNVSLKNPAEKISCIFSKESFSYTSGNGFLYSVFLIGFFFAVSSAVFICPLIFTIVFRVFHRFSLPWLFFTRYFTFVLLYRECDGFERTFFTPRRFLPYTLSQHLAQPAFTKVPSFPSSALKVP